MINSLLTTDSLLGSITFLVAGFVLLIKGGDLLVDGAVSTARKFAIPMSFIGLTIVAFGTSAPELFTSAYAGLQGRYDIAMTNVLGSNIFNICIVIGIVGLLYPFSVDKRNFRWDWYWLVLSTLMLTLFSWDLNLHTTEAAILFLSYFGFIILSWNRMRKQNPKEHQLDFVVNENSSTVKDTLLIFAGFTGLIIGTRLAVKGGVQLGAYMGLSDRFIGLIILSTGTSLPELITSVVAAKKGHSEIALSNVVGSNLANILIALGVAGTLTPFHITPKVFTFDVLIVLFITVLLGLVVFTSKKKFNRFQGLILLAVYTLYFYKFVL